MSLSDLIGNKFWDNSDPKGEKIAVIFDTDKRKEFLIEFSKFAESYCTKNTKWQAKPLGLFGTGCGMTLIIKGNIKKDNGLSISTLVKKFGDENNIPVYVSGNNVFSNKYSQVCEDEKSSYSYTHSHYSTRAIDAYMEVYGKPLYVKTDNILGSLSEYLEMHKNEEFITIKNYNYVGYMTGEPLLLSQALNTIGEDFDVINDKDLTITIQTDEYDLLKKLEYKYKLLKE